MNCRWIVAALGVVALDGAAAAEFSFGAPERLILERKAVGNVAIGDANGDGRADLAVAMREVDGTYRLSLFLQRQDGTLPPALEFELPDAPFETGYSVSLADMDGNGIDEFILGSSHPEVIVARYDGTSILAMDRHQARRGCEYHAVGDMDGDGHLDVACHNWQYTATFYYGDGAGGFETREMTTSAGAYDPYWHFKGLRLGDVTGDGRPDLLATDSLINSFFVHQNDGQRGFRPGRTYTHPPSPNNLWAAAIEVIDLGGDGTLEVVTASPDNQPHAMLNLHRRQANGFLRRTARLQSHDSITALQAFDVDGDGLQDLVAGHYDFNAVTVTRQAGGDLAGQSRFELPGFLGHSNALALGDLNSDGCVDLAGASYSGALVLYGCREFESSLPEVDYDGDGVSDVLWQINTTSVTAAIWRWADDLAYLEDLYAQRGHIPYVPGPVYVQAQNDFNGDGATDLFWRNLETGVNEIVLSGFYRRPVATLADQTWQVVGAGDFDGDDRADLLWRNGQTGANAIWLSADETTRQEIEEAADVRWNVAGIGDFNDDGRSDLLWRHATSGRNYIWFGARRANQKALPTINLEWRVAGVGDFDGDGKDDVVWRNATSGSNTIWLAANASTQQKVRAVTNTDWTIAIIGDYNGDGRSDLFWRNQATGKNVIWHSANSVRQQAVASTPLYYKVIR